MGTNGVLAPWIDDFSFHAPELLFTADKSGAVLKLSEPLARLLGSEVKRGTKLAMRIHPDDRRVFRREWVRIGKGAGPAQFDCRLRGADGAYHAWSFRAEPSPRTGVIHGALRNQGADQVEPLSELEKQSAILRLIQDNIPLCVWAIDTQGIFTHHAGAGLRQAGLAQGQWLGKNIFELYSEENVVEVRAALAGESKHSLNQAHGIHWENWQFPVRDNDGRVKAVVGLSLDVTEAKRAELALREKLALIERQAQVIRALSTPIIEVWDRVVTLPLLGVLDSGRAAEVMESLLAQVSKKGARFAILDLTGVDAVDTATAGHLLRLIQAIRLLGATGVISGIQPSVAQTMVSIGIDLKDIGTFASLRDALRHCMARMKDSALAAAAHA